MLGDERPRPFQRPILVIGGQDLVASLQRQRPSHDIQCGGDVADIHHVVMPSAQILCQRCPRVGEQTSAAAAQKFHRLTLELGLPRLVALERRP